MDIATQYWDSVNNAFIRVYEAASRDSFPNQPVWSWRYEYNGYSVEPIGLAPAKLD
jgi:hypothetical protein